VDVVGDIELVILEEDEVEEREVEEDETEEKLEVLVLGVDEDEVEFIELVGELVLEPNVTAAATATMITTMTITTTTNLETACNRDDINRILCKGQPIFYLRIR